MPGLPGRRVHVLGRPLAVDTVRPLIFRRDIRRTLLLAMAHATPAQRQAEHISGHEMWLAHVNQLVRHYSNNTM